MGTGRSGPVPPGMGPRLLLLASLLVLAACGEKVPESGAAKQVGDAPRQIVDKVAADAAAAAIQGGERSKSEEDRK